jgi:hypothetical protein
VLPEAASLIGGLVVLRFSLCSACTALAAATAAGILDAHAIIGQQPGVSLSPFVTFLPTGASHPMAGLALAVADGPLALRGSGHVSLQENNAAAPAGVTARPWGADADALAFLESTTFSDHVLFTPYVFAGVGIVAVDTAARRISRQGWSYGGGLTAPLGSALGMFAEARWRMSEFVLPDANNAPPAAREFRVGVNFRVGSGGSAPEVMRVISAEGSVLGSMNSGSSDLSSRLLSTADQYVGAPYRRGGMSPSGFDASGFVRFVFSRLGVTLPRSSRDQARVGQAVRVDVRSLEPGDLVMFEDGNGITHVAIYVGRSQIIHSSESGGGVRYDDLTTDRGRWFLSHLVAARRVRPDSRGASVDLARGFPGDDGSDDAPDHAPRAARSAPRRRP